MKVIAFDAARNSTGYAYLNGVLWVTGTFNIEDYREIIQVIRNACMDGCTHAAVEDPFGGPSIGVFKALQDAASRIQQRCEDAGLLCVPIRAIEWQAAQGCLKPRKETKQNARKLAVTLGANPKASQDEMDAVCLCDYVTQNMPYMEGRWHGKGGKVVK